MGGPGETYIKAHQWQLGLSNREAFAEDWYVNHRLKEALSPFGQPLHLNTYSLDLSVAYAVTSRFSLQLTLPFSYNTHSRIYPDTKRHQATTFGLGDVNLIGTMWLWDPARQPRGNLAFGFGIKSPTGRYDMKVDNFLPNGVIQHKFFEADQAIWLGDGGWGVIVQAQGFHRIAARWDGYFSGSYMLSTRSHTNVRIDADTSKIPFFVGIPDVYEARLGAAFAAWPSVGLSASMGGYISGIPLNNVITGADEYFRRPGYTLYVEPGLSLVRGKGTFSLSIPLLVDQNFQASHGLLKRFPRYGGDLADYLFLLAYTRRL